MLGRTTLQVWDWVCGKYHASFWIAPRRSMRRKVGWWNLWQIIWRLHDFLDMWYRWSEKFSVFLRILSMSFLFVTNRKLRAIIVINANARMSDIVFNVATKMIFVSQSILHMEFSWCLSHFHRSTLHLLFELCLVKLEMLSRRLEISQLQVLIFHSLYKTLSGRGYIFFIRITCQRLNQLESKSSAHGFDIAISTTVLPLIHLSRGG